MERSHGADPSSSKPREQRKRASAVDLTFDSALLTEQAPGDVGVVSQPVDTHAYFGRGSDSLPEPVLPSSIVNPELASSSPVITDEDLFINLGQTVY